MKKTLNHNLKPYAWLLAVITAAIVAILLSGCYPLKKAERQTDKAYDHYPAMLAGKTRAWFPCITKDSTVTFDTTKANDSIAYFKAKADSLLAVKQKVLTERELVYKDTCTSIKDEYQSGFNLGYETGYYYGKSEAKKDTIRITTLKVIEDSAKIVAAEKKATDLQAKNSNLEKKIYAKNRIIWVVIVFGLLGWLLVAFFVYSITKRR